MGDINQLQRSIAAESASGDESDQLDSAATVSVSAYATAMHEMRSLLSAVATNLKVASELLPCVLRRVDFPFSEQTGDCVELVECVEDATSAAQRAVAICRETLQLRPTDSGGPARLDRCVALAARLFRRSLAPRIELTVADPPKVVVAPEPGELLQVLLNLLRNSLDAVRAQPSARIELQSWAAERLVFISISDNGPGLDPAELAAVFEPRESSKPEGMGLGLAISHRLVASWGGTLEVKPNHPRGATFVVGVPRAD